jgi:hypothetical protein
MFARETMQSQLAQFEQQFTNVSYRKFVTTSSRPVARIDWLRSAMPRSPLPQDLRWAVFPLPAVSWAGARLDARASVSARTRSRRRDAKAPRRRVGQRLLGAPLCRRSRHACAGQLIVGSRHNTKSSRTAGRWASRAASVSWRDRLSPATTPMQPRPLPPLRRIRHRLYLQPNHATRPVRAPIGVTTRKCSECTTSGTEHERRRSGRGRLWPRWPSGAVRNSSRFVGLLVPAECALEKGVGRPVLETIHLMTAIILRCTLLSPIG